MNRTRTVILVTLVLALTALPLAAQSAQSAKPANEQPPLTPLAKELETVRKMLTNAQAKFNRKAMGVDQSNGARKTPGRTCCSGNLTHIEQSVATIRQLVRERGVCFERQRSREDVEIVNLVQQDLRSLENALANFAESPDPRDTQQALYGTTRAFLNLKKSTAALKDCKTN